MLTLQSARPSHALRPYVRAYAQRKTNITGAPRVEPVPARLEQTLEFEFGDPFNVCFFNRETIISPSMTVVGWQNALRAEVHLIGAIESFAVFFQPAGFSQLFGVPMTMLRNQAFEATSILGDEIRSLWNQLGEAASFSRRIAIVERFLCSFLHRAAITDPIAASANRMLSQRGVVSVDDLAHRAKLSRRQFERRFLAVVGATPKSFSRIARFQTALDLKVIQPHRTWLDTAYDLGYYDQMHLIHDFQKLAGNTPDRLIRMLGDMRPGALASSALDSQRDQ
jgi:AraC-like DNA-binding protein